MSNQPNILFYIFIIIFSITAIITLLGITNVIKSIKDKYLNALFSALILEVVAAVLLSYKQIDFSCNGDAIVDKLISKTEGKDLESEDDKIDYLKTIIADYLVIKQKHENYKQDIAGLEEKLKTCSGQVTEVDNSYYMKIIKLRQIIKHEMDGTSINLVFNQDNKKAVFDILEQVFITLGSIDPDEVITPKYLTSIYIKFVKRYGLHENHLNYNEDGKLTGVYITDFSTSIMIRAYLEKFYAVN